MLFLYGRRMVCLIFDFNNIAEPTWDESLGSFGRRSLVSGVLH
jgi:hypothetical protein